jgi:hypothetical protein
MDVEAAFDKRQRSNILMERYLRTIWVAKCRASALDDFFLFTLAVIQKGQYQVKHGHVCHRLSVDDLRLPTFICRAA